MRGWTLPTGLGTSLGLGLGFLFGPRASPQVWMAIGGGALIALGILSRASAFPFRFSAWVLILGVAAGALRTHAPVALPAFESARIAGRIVSWEPGSRSVVVGLQAYCVDTHRLRSPVFVRVLAPPDWGTVPRSSWVRVAGQLQPNRGRTVPGAWQDRDTAATLLVDRSIPPEWGPGRPAPFMRVRAWMVERIDASLHGFPARFAVAILLGRTRSLTDDERDLFKRTGTSHVIAVSGFHVTLVAGLAALCLSALPRTPRILGASVIAWAYAALAGWVAPALRAAAAALAVALGAALGRPRSAPVWMMLVMPWLLWASPGFLTSVSFLLSVGAVAGIFFVAEAAEPLLHGRGRFLAPVIANLGAQWGTLPIILGAFGTLSPLSILPNLLAVPITGLLLPAVLFGLLLDAIGWHTNPFMDSAGALGGALLLSLRATARIPFVTGIAMPPAWIAALPFVVLAAWFSMPVALRQRPRARVLAFCAVLITSALFALPRRPPPGPWMAFLDVGQGDAAVLRLSDGTVWVMDVGDDRGAGDAARRSVLPFLRWMRIRAIDGCIVSHRHRDHVGAIASFAGGIPVRHVFDAGVGSSGGTSGVVDSVLAVHRLWPCLVAAGDTLHVRGSVSIVAVHPARTESGLPPAVDNLNEASLVIRLQDGPHTLLLAGDAERDAEEACVTGHASIRADVLKVPHHGSDTSSSEAFLDAVHPTWAIISVGEQNKFHHPSPQVLERLRGKGIRVLTTAKDGTILFTWSDAGPEIRTFPPRARLELP
jgi:competence protein ComEC